MLFVGDRLQADRAARALGWEVVKRPEEGPDTVVALTEAAVLPAADLRAALGLDGLAPAAALRCRDKVRMKEAIRAHGLACTDWIALDAASDPRAIARLLGLPVYVKRRLASGGRGQVIAESVEQIVVGPGLLAERRVEGREMSVESIVVSGRPVWVNPTDYLVPGHAHLLPAGLDAASRQAVEALNAAAIAALGIDRGMTHLELFLTPRGPVFGEIAVRPPGGRITRLIRRVYGFDPWRAHLQAEAGEVPRVRHEARGCAGVWMLHPGAGVVRSIEGVQEARQVPGITRIRCRVSVGDRIAARQGTGEDIGFLEARGSDRQGVEGALFRAHALLAIALEPRPPGAEGRSDFTQGLV